MQRAVLCLAVVALVLVPVGCGQDAGSAGSESGAAEAGKPEPVNVAPRFPRPKRPAGGALRPPWGSALRDARHSSSSDVEGPRKGTVRWKRKLEGRVVPGPVVGRDGVVYAASNGGVLHALSLRDGKDRWTFAPGGSYGSDVSTSPAIAEDGTILWPGPGSTLYALSPAGKLRWKRSWHSFVLSPVVAGDRIYVVEMDGTAHALQRTGDGVRELWSKDLGGTSYGSPAVGRDGTVYTAAGTDLIALRGSDGRQRWRFGVGGT